MSRSERFVVTAFVTAVLGVLIAAFAPLASMCGVSSAGGQPRCSHESIFANEGTWVLVVVAVPVVIALVPFLWRWRPARIGSAVLLWACCVVGLFSVGIFFVPSAVLITIAAVIRDRTPQPVSGFAA